MGALFSTTWLSPSPAAPQTLEARQARNKFQPAAPDAVYAPAVQANTEPPDPPALAEPPQDSSGLVDAIVAGGGPNSAPGYANIDSEVGGVPPPEEAALAHAAEAGAPRLDQLQAAVISVSPAYKVIEHKGTARIGRYVVEQCIAGKWTLARCRYANARIDRDRVSQLMARVDADGGFSVYPAQRHLDDRETPATLHVTLGIECRMEATKARFKRYSIDSTVMGVGPYPHTDKARWYKLSGPITAVDFEAGGDASMRPIRWSFHGNELLTWSSQAPEYQDRRAGALANLRISSRGGGRLHTLQTKCTSLPDDSTHMGDTQHDS